jgi:hypothetical protein
VVNNTSEEPVDPRDFTPAEWNIISTVLRERARHLDWQATRPGLGSLMAEKAVAAAERRRALARRVVGAKIFCQELRDNAVS